MPVSPEATSFILCDMIGASIEGSKKSIVQLYALQLLKPERYLLGNEATFSAVIVLFYERNVLVAKYWADEWVLLLH